MLSKVQTSVFYSQGVWNVVDGDGTACSTNGTWLFARDRIELKDYMVFKANMAQIETRICKKYI